MKRTLRLKERSDHAYANVMSIRSHLGMGTPVSPRSRLLSQTGSFEGVVVRVEYEYEEGVAKSLSGIKVELTDDDSAKLDDIVQQLLKRWTELEEA